MFIITKKIKDLMTQKKLSLRELARLVDYKHGSLSNVINGKVSCPKDVEEKLLSILEISKEDFDSWILADKYPKDILKLAIQTKKDFPYKRKSILTTNIDKLLQEKNMSRTALAKQIGYSQSGLNRMITGQINMSNPVLEKISHVLELSQNQILSWIIADKYNLEVLEIAWSC